MNTNEIFDKLINAISSMSQVNSIGMSGSSALPKAGESDVDLFIYCDSIPHADHRLSALEAIKNSLDTINVQIFEGKSWGIGDFVSIDGIETWMMYFTEKDALADVESILLGEQPDIIGSYYPIGRCATLSNINILYDQKGFLTSMKTKLSVYPPQLAQTIIKHHIGLLYDFEEWDRAVKRKDVLFHHYALDSSIDHFLQTLFAFNNCYFPSRKRSYESIRKFTRAPEKCEERLLQVLRRGGYPDGIHESYEIWRSLLDEWRTIIAG